MTTIEYIAIRPNSFYKTKQAPPSYYHNTSTFTPNRKVEVVGAV